VRGQSANGANRFHVFLRPLDRPSVTDGAATATQKLLLKKRESHQRGRLPVRHPLRRWRRTVRLNARRPEADRLSAPAHPSPCPLPALGERVGVRGVAGDVPARREAAPAPGAPGSTRPRFVPHSRRAGIGGSIGGLASSPRDRALRPGESGVACRERRRRSPRAAPRTPPRPRRGTAAERDCL
jgi:hypothetical protein